MKASFFSPEHSPLSLYQTKLMQMATGKDFWKDNSDAPRMKEIDVEQYTEWAKDKLYFTSMEAGKTPNWDWLLDKFKEQLFNFGIDIFVIDAFNKVQLPKGNKIDAIGTVLTDLTNFAQANNVIVMLVAHPTKMKLNEQTNMYNVPTLYDVSGSADFYNQTHDGYCIYRIREDLENGVDNHIIFTNLKTKMKFQGEAGKTAEFSYHNPTGRFYPRGETYRYYSMLDKDKPLATVAEIKSKPKQSLSEIAEQSTMFEYKKVENQSPQDAFGGEDDSFPEGNELESPF